MDDGDRPKAARNIFANGDMPATGVPPFASFS